MAKIKWDSLAFSEKDNLVELDNKRPGKQRSRKWREVEQIKPQQKIRRARLIYQDDDE